MRNIPEQLYKTQRLLYDAAMVKRRVQKTAPEEPKVRTYKPKIKVDLSKLPDAVVEGRMTVPVGGRVVFERIAPKGRKSIHEGIVKSVNDAGVVEIWDETAEQFYAFSLKQDIPVVKAG